MKRTIGKMILEDIKDPESYPDYLEKGMKFLERVRRRWIEDIFNLLFQDENKEKKRILDVGSGTGILLRSLVKMAQTKDLNIEAIGLDKFPSVITFAKEKAEEEKLKNISFLEGDALEMPFPENHFNLVTASFLFFFFNEQELSKFFEEVYRVLKPRGKFYFLHTPRSLSMYLITYLFTLLVPRERRKLALDTIKYGYTADKTRTLINQSSLSKGKFIVRKKWGPLFMEVFGTINKSQKG